MKASAVFVSAKPTDTLMEGCRGVAMRSLRGFLVRFYIDARVNMTVGQSQLKLCIVCNSFFCGTHKKIF